MNKRGLPQRCVALIMVAALALLGGCASQAPRDADGNDPLENTNRAFYDFNDALDRNLLMPVAEVYHDYTPAGFRTGIGNLFNNLSYLNVILNDLLQGKFLQGLQDTGRVIVNSTLGFGGFFDVATPMGLVEHDEDFGQTLGVWGAGEGTFLMLPILGPNSTRDLPGAATSVALNPLVYIGSIYTLPVGFLQAINTRAALLEATRVRDEAALDPYTFTREAYRQQREFKIYDGNPPIQSVDFDDFEEDASSPTQAVSDPGGSTQSPATAPSTPGTGGADEDSVLKIE